MNWSWNECRRCRQDLSLLASGGLPESERSGCERHLADCAECRERYHQIKSVAESLADYRKSTVSLEPTQAARQNWARAIRAASQTEHIEQFGSRHVLVRWWRELFRPYRRAWGGIAALWFVMWAVNWESPQIQDGVGASSVSKSVITQTFAENRRWLAELIPAADPQPAEAPRQKAPPRSERQRPWVMG